MILCGWQHESSGEETNQRAFRESQSSPRNQVARLSESPTAHVSSIPQGHSVWGVEDHRDRGKDNRASKLAGAGRIDILGVEVGVRRPSSL